MDDTKIYANRGVERNKKPLRNIIYEITESKGEEGKWIIFESYQGNNPVTAHIGRFSLEELKVKLGDKQYGKFRQGKRKFIIQRRVDGRNVKKTNT